MTLAEPVPSGNTYDKYGSTNPVERRLMTGFLTRLERSLPADAPARSSRWAWARGRWRRALAGRYAGASVVGVDLPAADLAAHWAARQLPATFADVCALPFRDHAFDLVLAIEVLEHVAAPDDALREIVRVARADVLLSVPREPLWRIANMARGKYLSAYGNTPGHLQHWSRRAFVRLVDRHLEVTAVHSPPPWTMVAARVRR